MSKKKILFIHQNFPGQFKFLAPALSDKYDVQTLSVRDTPFKDIIHHKYKLPQESTEDIFILAAEFESKTIRAYGVATKCLELKEKGYVPDLIICHPGWGEAFFLKEVWPKTKMLSYFEFYYRSDGLDVDFDLDEQEAPENDFNLAAKLAARNAPTYITYNISDRLISPTEFQKNTAPEEFLDKIHVIHDGIDTKVLKRDKDATILIKNSNKQLELTINDKIICFVNRNLEPYRGYHIFMRTLPKILEKHPDAYVLIVGGDGVSYGSTPKNGKKYRDIYFNEVKDQFKDLSRIHFLGRVDYSVLLTIFSISTVHVYLTYPFVLSWSTLESMALESIIVASKTPSVQEVMKHNKNGLLVDFFDKDSLAKTVISVLDDPKKFNKLGKNARETIVKKYDLLDVCLPKQIELVEELLNES